MHFQQWGYTKAVLSGNGHDLFQGLCVASKEVCANHLTVIGGRDTAEIRVLAKRSAWPPCTRSITPGRCLGLFCRAGPWPALASVCRDPSTEYILSARGDKTHPNQISKGKAALPEARQTAGFQPTDKAGHVPLPDASCYSDKAAGPCPRAAQMALGTPEKASCPGSLDSAGDASARRVPCKAYTEPGL